MSKTLTPAPNPHRTPSTKHPSPDGIPARSESNAQPYPMIFLNWIDPPIGLTLNNVSYKVSLMNVGVSGGGQSFIMPYAEQVAWNPLVTPSAVVQYQLTSTLGTDPGQDYYETMTLTQASEGCKQSGAGLRPTAVSTVHERADRAKRNRRLAAVHSSQRSDDLSQSHGVSTVSLFSGERSVRSS